VLLPVLFLLIGLGLLGYSGYEVVQQRTLDRDGVRTEGEVVRHRRTSSNENPRKPALTAIVRFADAQGQVHEVTAGSSGVEGLPVGGRAPVRYLPGSPRTARVDLPSKQRQRLIALPAGGAIFTTVALIMLTTH